jgi:hypothetical protein
LVVEALPMLVVVRIPKLPPLTVTVPELVVVALPLFAGASMPSVPLALMLPELMQVRSPLL